MDQVFDIDNKDKYKSYIQRRRVGQNDSDASVDSEIQEGKSSIAELEASNLFKDFNTSHDDDLLSFRKKEDDNSYNYQSRDYIIPPPSRSSYKKDKTPYRSNYPSKYDASNKTEISDNNVAKFAIKVIKQALACFAVLGIIVFLQQRNDTGTILGFLKTNIVDNHTDLQDLTIGVQNIITECTKLFSSSP